MHRPKRRECARRFPVLVLWLLPRTAASPLLSPALSSPAPCSSRVVGSHTREYCLSKPFVLGKEAECCPNCFCCELP